jgi:hypothetical protein
LPKDEIDTPSRRIPLAAGKKGVKRLKLHFINEFLQQASGESVPKIKSSSGFSEN